MKTLDKFHKHKNMKDGLHGTCKECRASDPKSKITNKVYRSNNYEQCRNNELKREYGIDIEIFNNMYLVQDKKCDICKNVYDIRDLQVDHDHNTNKVRSLLCRGCNMAFGILKENINTINNMAEYKKKYTEFIWKWINY
jgi:hypothetical protein